MIKQIPGWANYFVLWFIYMNLTVWVMYAINKMREMRYIRFIKGTGWIHSPEPKKWHEHIDWLYCFVISAVYCGAYLAKWRFWDEGWHFW